MRVVTGSHSCRQTTVWSSQLTSRCPVRFIHSRCVDGVDFISPWIKYCTKRSAAARNVSVITGAAAAQKFSSLEALPYQNNKTVFDPDALARAAGVQSLVQCGLTPLGRGLVAPHALERQAIVSVPLENTFVITDEPLSGISVFGDRCQELWQQHHGQLPQQLLDFLGGEARWDVRMTAWLLWVASELPDSPVWGSYLSSLPPVGEVTCLLNYGEDDARELQFKELVEEARTQHKWALSVHRSYFDRVHGELRQLRLAESAEDTLWAMSMVRTRTFSEDVNGEGLTLMVPYADMANHSFQHNATFCMAPGNKRFDLRLMSPLAAGEEATICYGEGKPNFEIMRDYGFIVPGNPNDRITLPNQDSLPALNGASLLEALGFKGDWRSGGKVVPTQDLLTLHTTSPKRDSLTRLALARRRSAVLSMNLSDGFPAQTSGGLFGGWPAATAWTDAGRPPPQHLRSSAAAISRERAAVTIVRQSYQVALDKLPTSIAQDEALLTAHNQEAAGAVERLTGLMAAAVRCRLDHKLLLAEAVRTLEMYDMWLDERQRLCHK